MAILKLHPLFHWNHLDSADDLSRFLLVRDNLPDAPLVAFLEKRRGKGRDDYPIRPMWNLVLAGIVFQHPSAASLPHPRGLSKPRPPRALRFQSLPPQKNQQVEGNEVTVLAADVPTEDALGRFLSLLIAHPSLIDDMFYFGRNYSSRYLRNHSI